MDKIYIFALNKREADIKYITYMEYMLDDDNYDDDAIFTTYPSEDDIDLFMSEDDYSLYEYPLKLAANKIL